MSTLQILSVSLNTVLVVACLMLTARGRRKANVDAIELQMIQQEANAHRRQAETARGEYLALGQSVAHALKEVREDIDRNYGHTHDGHLLDRLAYEIEIARGPIFLDAFLTAEVHASGGAKFIVDGELSFSGALNLAWHIHAQARRRAGELYIVTRESCGRTERAAWLGKTLALYERICDGDKEVALASLSAVLEEWRYCDLDRAIFFTTPSQR